MATPHELSRRERQIMDVLYTLEGGTVAEVRDRLPDPPTDMAVRRLLHILEEKGHVRHKTDGPRHVFLAKVPRKRAGAQALQHVLDTFFDGALTDALATHLSRRPSQLNQEDIDQLAQLIEQARRDGR